MTTKITWQPAAAVLGVLTVTALLTSCNGQEDFADAAIGGPIIGGGGSEQIPPAGEDALEVELVLAKVVAGTPRSVNVANLSYSCGGARARVPGSGERPFIARCPTSATAVDFFIGDLLTGAPRIQIGTFFVPAVTGRVGVEGSQVGGPGFYQTSLADIVPVAQIGDTASLLGSPARRSPQAAEVLNRAAFLAALDDTPEDDNVLFIAEEGHDQAGDAPTTGFTQAAYADFLFDWQPWLDQVDATTDDSQAFPANGADARALALTAANRSRAGFYRIECQTDLGLLNCSQGGDALSLDIAVMPDDAGTVIGLGVLGSVSADELETLALSEGQQISDTLLLQDGWNVRSSLRDGVDLDFDGRIIGSGLYEFVQNTGTGLDDYRGDYSATGIYQPDQAVDQSRFSGVIFGATVGDSDGFLPIRGARIASLSASLDPAVMSLAPRFYRLELRRLCESPTEDLDCTPIPPDEIGSNGNYPTTVSLQGSTLTSSHERPRDDLYPNALNNAAIQVEILDNGVIITDSNFDCSNVDQDLVDADSRQERAVGFVSRTAAGAQPSINVVLLLAGDETLAPPAPFSAEMTPLIPQYGARVEGRIDLADPLNPIRRLGDDNFAAGIRATWFDDKFHPWLFRSEVPDPQNLTVGQQFDILSVAGQVSVLTEGGGAAVPPLGGAVEGVAITPLCLPVSP